MKIQTWINIILFAFVGILIGVNLRGEKETPQLDPINTELYEYKFKEMQSQIDTLYRAFDEHDTVINSIKFNLVTNEKTIRNASNPDVDSIFNAMVARQRKGSVR